MARIIIPKNKGAAISLAQNILAKHKNDGAASPLTPLNIADMTTKTTTADTQNQLSDKLYRDAETATQNCGNALGADYTTPGTVNCRHDSRQLSPALPARRHLVCAFQQ